MAEKRRPADEQFTQALEHHRAGRLVEAERLYRQICAANPRDFRSFHVLGVVAHQLGRNDAVDLIGRALILRPEFSEAHNDLGVILGARGRYEDAAECFERAVALKPAYAEAHNNLGSALGNLGRFADAMACFERALAIDPKFALAHAYCGNALKAQGKLDEAVVHFRRALDINPNFAMAHYALGALLKEQGRTDEAVLHYQRVVALMPNFAEAHANLGGALKEAGRIEEAVRHCERALALKPDFAGAHNNLANALAELGKLDEAIAHYDRAIALAADFAPAHYNRGVALRGQSRFAEALASFEQALANEPGFIEAKFASCMARLPILYTNEAEIAKQRAEYEDCLRSLLEDVERSERPGALAKAIGAHQPFYLAYQGRNDRNLQEVYGSVVAKITAARYDQAPLPDPPAADEPVKVGIVSGFFRHHSNWKIPIKGWLSQLDRRRFRLFGYHTGTEQDAETTTAAALCERFVQGPLSIDRWRRTILDDAPHVLIYPEVGMDRVCPQLAAQRLAPVQCNSWGHPETSGLPTLDYYLSSDLMEPPTGESHYTERLVRLPNLSIYCEPPEHRPVSLARADLGLRSTAKIFWGSQAVYKYLPQFDQIFPRIAREVGDCQFTFIRFPGAAHITELFSKRLERAFMAFGLNAAEHCIILPRLEPDRYAAAAGLCDVGLDSIGWSGCNSTLECLVHDLPIVTLRGTLMRGRHTAAIMEMMGVVETITETTDQYVSTAVRLAQDLSMRTALKARISASKRRIYRDRTCIAALEDFLDAVARGHEKSRIT